MQAPSETAVDAVSEECDNSLTYVPIVDGVKNPPYYRVGEHGEKIPITKAEYKRGMLAAFTIKHPVNPTCGHHVTIGYEPRHRHCEACWFAYFQTHGEITKIAEEIFQTHGHDEGSRIVAQIKGRVFLNNYRKFMSTVAKWKTDIEAAQQKEQN